MTKIFVAGLGGTIGSVRRGSIGLDSNNLKILDYVKYDDVIFDSVSPFSVLSENMSIELWKRLVEFLNGVDFNAYDGVIILHGSDTLSFTSAIIANAFPDKSIVIVASDKPIEDSTGNGVKNFDNAVEAIIKGVDCPMVSYDGLFKAGCVTSIGINDSLTAIDKAIVPANSDIIYDKNILIINGYVGINADNYDLSNVDAVLVGMYHSATIPVDFARKIEKSGKPVYYVTHKSSADYETALGLHNIIFNSTIENAYARILLTNGDLVL